MSEIIDRELSWDDEISRESDFVLIPEGDYTFTVTGFERGRHEGSDKLPPCNKAIVTLRIELPDGSTQELKHNLFLHSKTEGLLSAFFTCIGQKKKGEPLRMNWGAIIGARGRCKVSTRTYKTRDGADGQSNDIKKFYPPEDVPTPIAQPVQPAAPAGVFTPGKF